MGVRMRYVVKFCLVGLALSWPFNSLASDLPAREVTVFLVTGYDYQVGPSGENPPIGRSLCATRCNAFSSDHQNYTDAGGWRMIKTASAEKITVELNNPFLDGSCVCTADRYKVIVNELYPDRSVLGDIKEDPVMNK